MKLKCRIHEKEYDIVSGATFSEEYNETLDSGSIILDHVAKIKDLKPYDDVYIWNADEEFIGYYNVGDRIPVDVIGGKIEATLTTTPGDVTGWISQTSEVTFTSEGEFFLLAGQIINIWRFLFDKNNQDSRWRINNLTFKFLLKPLSDLSLEPKIGYYEIGLSREDDTILGDYLVLKKSTEYESDEELPPFLFVFFETRIPSTVFLTSMTDAALVLSNNAIETLDEGFTGESWQIQEIDYPTGVTNYIYYKNTDTKTKINLSIRGLTDEEIKNIDNINLKVLVNGTLDDLFFDNNYNDFHIISNTQVRLNFKYGPSYFPTSSFEIILIKQQNGLWVGEKDFEVRIVESDYGNTVNCYVDSILNDLTDGAFTIISISQQQVLPKFFKHLLVDSFTCDMVDFEEGEMGKAENYKYKIDLFSETKRLEKIILPNISITQPIIGNKRSIWFYLNQYVKLYSPKIKMMDENDTWTYRNKFKIDERLPGDYGLDDEYLRTPVHEIFDDTIYAPELSLTAPTLREILSRLMIVKDCIPIVKNDVIYAMKISDSHGEFKTDGKKFSFISESMSSANYSTAFRREYGGAISQKNSTHMVEFLGFRNRENALMTLDNMYLETRFPIYKINSLYMCYYKSIHIQNIVSGEEYDKLVLVKQDISRLVLQNAVRDSLPADWTKLPSGAWIDITTEQMSKYRLLTLGYDIGSNKITGWGEKYSYISDLLGWAHATYTYIETIMNMIDKVYPFGLGQMQFLTSEEEVNQSGGTGWKNCMITPNNSDNVADALKSLFFQMDYIGMYSGTIVHSKENIEDDDIQTSDNCSTSLSILEVDGLFEKEKANRLGNNEVGFIARFNDVYEMNEDYNDILGSSWGDNIVIYHKEYQIYDNCVLANFIGTKDYVMKNYFTTVFAKYRTYSYASYNESVNRAENDKYLVVLSDDSCLYEFGSNDILNIKSILSAFSESIIGEDLYVHFTEQINGGYFSFENGNDYFSDVAQFVSGYSLCFNIKMYDTITNGSFISTLNCYDDDGVYIGSAQDWYKMPITESDGFVEKIGCYFGHFDESAILENNVIWNASRTTALFKPIFEMPLKQRMPKFKFGKKYDICKDEKEIIDFTLQYEVINQDKDVLMSEWLMKLTDFNNYVKLPVDTEIIDNSSFQYPIKAYFGSAYVNWNFGLWLGGWGGNTYTRQIMLRMPQETADALEDGVSINNCYTKRWYYATCVVPFGGGLTISVYCYICLGKISQVIRDGNNNITQLKVRAFFMKASSMSQTIGTTTFPDESENTITLTFDARESGEEGMLEFFFQGQDAPGFGDSERLSLNNVSLSDAVPMVGGIFGTSTTIPFPQTMYILKSTKQMEQSLIYSQYKINNLPDFLSIIPVSPTEYQDGKTFKDIFEIKQDENGRPYIQFKDNAILGRNYESVQYWYYDRDGDGYLHFVFGINVNKNTGDKKAYISLVKNRNRKVYNALHREAGVVMNFADEANEDKYGKQLYEPKVGD